MLCRRIQVGRLAVRRGRCLCSTSGPGLQELVRADLLTREGRYGEARQQLDRAGQVLHALPDDHPLRVDLKRRLILLHQCEGDFAKEARLRAELVRSSPENAGVADVSAYAVSLLRFGAYKPAMNALASCMAACARAKHPAGTARCGLLTGYTLFLEGSELAGEVLGHTFKAASVDVPDDSVIGLLHAGTGLVHEHTTGHIQAARESYTRALRFFERTMPSETEEAAKMLVKLGRVEATAKDRPASEAHFGRALRLIEGEYGAGHARLSRVLRQLAKAYIRFEEPVLAEGLFRSSTDNLRNAIKHSAGYDTALVNLELADNLTDFAALLRRLEWNGKPRTREADECAAEVLDIQKRFPPLASRKAAHAQPWSEQLVESILGWKAPK